MSASTEGIELHGLGEIAISNPSPRAPEDERPEGGGRSWRWVRGSEGVDLGRTSTTGDRRPSESRRGNDLHEGEGVG